jgi:hypothetical protein
MALKTGVFHFHFSTSLFHSCYLTTPVSNPSPFPIILSSQIPYKQPAQPNHIHTLLNSINSEPNFFNLEDDDCMFIWNISAKTSQNQKLYQENPKSFKWLIHLNTNSELLQYKYKYNNHILKMSVFGMKPHISAYRIFFIHMKFDFYFYMCN